MNKIEMINKIYNNINKGIILNKHHIVNKIIKDGNKYIILSVKYSKRFVTSKITMRNPNIDLIWNCVFPLYYELECMDISTLEKIIFEHLI